MSRLYAPSVYRWCRKAGLQTDDASDVAQEVFRSVADNLGQFRHDRPGDSFRGWLWTITRNKIYDHFRAMKARPDAAGGTTVQRRFRELPETLPAENDAISLNTSGLARRAMELMETDFEPNTWQAFWRTAVDQQPAGTVARELGMSAAAVYMAKSRVLRRLRDELGGLSEFA